MIKELFFSPCRLVIIQALAVAADLKDRQSASGKIGHPSSM